jgi:hypothetical protein
MQRNSDRGVPKLPFLRLTLIISFKNACSTFTRLSACHLRNVILQLKKVPEQVAYN